MKKSKLALAVMAAILATSLVGCGGNGTDVNEQASVQKEFIYVPEYISLVSDENTSFYDVFMKGNSLYYTQYTYDPATMTGKSALMKYSLDTSEAGELPITFEENSNVNQYVVDSHENIYTIEYVYGMPDVSGMYEKGSQYLCKYDAAGNQVYRHDLTEILESDPNNNWVSDIAADEQGRIYMTSDNLIRLFDTEGNLHGSIEHNNGWINSIGTGKDGKVYICYYDQNSANGGMAMTEINFDGKQTGQTYTNYPNGNGNGNLSVGVEKDFLISDSSKVYEYDLATQTYEVLFEWLDSDINGTYVDYVGALDNGKLLAIIRDWNTGKTELAYLTKTASAQLPVKQSITIGTLYESQALQALAVEFNKSSDDYRINIKTYIDQNNWTETSWQDGINSLNNDITSKANCPDLIDLSGLNVQMLVAKGVLEDLHPYLEGSSLISKEDFMASIIEGYTFDGKLVCIPGSFNLATLAAKTSDVGSEMGWTLEEMMAYSKANPDAELFDNYTKNSMIYLMMTYNQNAFLNWETGECKFDSQEFKQLLEFVNAFPDEYTWSEDEPSTPVKLQAGDVLLDNVYVYSLESIQEYEAKFNEPVTFIGYPNADGNAGCYFTGSDTYAISSKSENKEAAWKFIESYLAKEPSNRFSGGLPSNIEYFEKKVAEETKVEYVLDENGEPMLDENGDPIPMGGTSGIGYGDWEYTFHIPTEEEVNQIRELIEVAVPSFTSDNEILNIINEECEAYFQGQKSVDDVAGIIQSRVKVYVNENS